MSIPVNTLILFHSLMEKQHIEHKLILPNEDPTIKADQRQFQQMIVHLVRNAVEAMPDGGFLTVEVVYDDENTTISIRDTGPGLWYRHGSHFGQTDCQRS